MITIIFYSDEKYEYQAVNLLQSFMVNGKVNDYNFVYYTIGFHSGVIAPNLTKKFWAVDEKIPRSARVGQSNRIMFEFYKPDICLDALTTYDEVCFMDVDIIISRRFDITKIKNNKSFPLSSKGPFEYIYTYEAEDGVKIKHDEVPLMEFYNIPKRTMWYVTTCFMMINKNCIDFLKEWRSMCKNEYLLEHVIQYMPFLDETAYNVCLWKRNVTENLGHIFVNTHKYTTIKLIEENDDIQKIKVDNILEEHCEDSSKVMFYHGTKEVDENDKIFEYYKNRNKGTITQSVSTTPKLFTVQFDDTQNKFDFQYNGQTPNRLILVAIKDIDSRACLWSFINTGYNCWCVPTPFHLHSFKADPDFGGVRIEYFENDIFLDYDEIRIKTPKSYKPQMDLTNTEPIFVNYNEFFVEKVYDSVDLNNKKLVFDIGANVGLWTKFIQSKGADIVFCFEPNPVPLKDLYRNFAQDSSVTIVPKGIYYENTSLEFYNVESNSLLSSFYPAASEKNGVPIGNISKIEVITLESIIEKYKIKKIDLVKFDIEGAEFDIFDHLPLSVFNVVDSFLIEEHSQYFDNSKEKVTNLMRILNKYQYLVHYSKNHKFLYAEKINKS